MNRRTAVVGLLTALGSLLILGSLPVLTVALAEPDPGPHAGRHPTLAPDRAPPPAEGTAPTIAVRRAAPERTRIDAPPAAPESDPRSPLAGATLHGPVTVLATGSEQPVERGRLLFTFSTGTSAPTGVWTPVRRGRFELVLPGSAYDVRVVEGRWNDRLCGVVASLDHDLALEPPAGFHEVAVRLRALQPVVVDVVDDTTGEPLRDVRAEHSGLDGHRSDSDSHLVVEGDSPLTLAYSIGLGDGRAETFRFRTPHHAWRTARIDFSEHTRVTVRLERHGALEVVLADWTGGMEAEVHVHRQGLIPVGSSRRLRRPGAARFERLPEGEYRIRADAASQHWHLPQGERAVVQRGTHNRVVLEAVPEPTPPDRVAVRGVLRVEGDWPRDGIQLHLERDDRTGPPRQQLVFGLPDLVALDDERLVWEGTMHEGPWIAHVEPFGLLQDLEVRPGTADALELVVGAPANVDLTVVTRRAPDDPPAPGVCWSARHTPRSGHRWSRPAREESEPGRYRLRVPAGVVELEFSDGYVPVDGQNRFEVHPGHNELRVAVQLGGRLSLRFRDGASEIEPPSDTPIRLRPVDHPGRVIRRHGTGFEVTHPGIWELQVADLPGYRDLRSKLLEIPAGFGREHRWIDLERVPR